MFKSLSLVAAVWAFCVVVLGAYVRLSDAGLGCPDWPGCYGTLTVPESESAIAQAQLAFPDKPLETGKAWKEMAHRYLAGGLGLLVVLLAYLAVRQRKQIATPASLSVGLVVLIACQGLLGMWTVTLLLKPAIVTMHLLGGMTTLAILTVIAYKHLHITPVPCPALHTLWLRGLLLIVFVQLVLGGWTSTNYAALACTDFPTCHGAWWPDMDLHDGFHIRRALGQSAYGGQLHLEALTAIQWMHRLGAVVVVLWTGVSVWLLRRIAPTLALALAFILFIQVSIGVSNLILHLPLVLAVMHNAGAALLVVTAVIINASLQPAK